MSNIKTYPSILAQIVGIFGSLANIVVVSPRPPSRCPSSSCRSTASRSPYLTEKFFRLGVFFSPFHWLRPAFKHQSQTEPYAIQGGNDWNARSR